METPPTLPPEPGERYLPFEALLDTGILWLIKTGRMPSDLFPG